MKIYEKINATILEIEKDYKNCNLFKGDYIWLIIIY